MSPRELEKLNDRLASIEADLQNHKFLIDSIKFMMKEKEKEFLDITMQKEMFEIDLDNMQEKVVIDCVNIEDE